jgi:hypothetical protein
MTASPTAASSSAASSPHERSASVRPKLRADDLYFGAMVLLIVGTVFLGFARTYYLAPIYHSHVRNLLIGLHGAVFTAWIVLLVVQTTLVARRNIALHRRLGIFGAGLAVAMVGLGIAAATDSLARGFSPPGFPFGPVVFYSIPIFGITTFAVLIFFGIYLRSNGPAHKRLVLLATLTLMGAAFGRWPFAFAHTPRFHWKPDLVVSRRVRPVNDSTNSSRHTPGSTLHLRDRRSHSAYRKIGRMA